MAQGNRLAQRSEFQNFRSLDQYAADLNRDYPNTVEATVLDGNPRSLHLKFRGIVTKTDFDCWIEDLANGRLTKRMFDEAPERFKVAAECQMLVWRHEDGTYSPRKRRAA